MLTESVRFVKPKPFESSNDELLLSAAQAVEDALDSMPALEGSALDVKADAKAEGSRAEAAHGVHPDVEAEGFDSSAAIAAAEAESSESKAERGGKVSWRRPGQDCFKAQDLKGK